MSWADVLRLIGLGSAAFALGALIVLALASDGTTGFRVPWRYWFCLGGIIACSSGIVARIALWGTPFNVRDVIFVLVNGCFAVAAVGAMTATEPLTPEVERQIRGIEAELRAARESLQSELRSAHEALKKDE